VSLHGKKAGNPTARTNASARRRSREAAGASVRALTLDELYARDKGVCYRCRVRIARSKATKDHVVPLSRGGRDTPGNSRLCCRRHNSSKGARTLAEVEKAEARHKARGGLRRSPLRPKPKPLAKRAQRARQKAAEHGRDDSGVVYADTVPEEDLF
jgi:HNH endonuclease